MVKTMYVRIYSLDNRPLVQNLVLDNRGTCLKGPFTADFPENVLLPLQDDQDVESDDLGYYVKGGDQVLFNYV